MYFSRYSVGLTQLFQSLHIEIIPCLQRALSVCASWIPSLSRASDTRTYYADMAPSIYSWNRVSLRIFSRPGRSNFDALRDLESESSLWHILFYNWKSSLKPSRRGGAVKLWEEKNEQISKSMNDGGICRAAPHICPWLKVSLSWSRSSIKMPEITVSKLPELVIFGGPLSKSQFSAVSATIFLVNVITGNIWSKVHGQLCPGFTRVC